PCAFGGNGITVVQDWKQVPKKELIVVQKYISNPLLVNGSKIDLRVYVEVTSINPLRIYVNPEGIVRISVEKYTMKDLNNRAIHLTNENVNSKNSVYYIDEKMVEGYRRSLTWFWDYLKENHGVEREPIWDRIKDLVIKTILSGEDTMQRSTQHFIRNRYSVHELFAFDILLDGNMKPWVMEVNVSPRFDKNIVVKLMDPLLTSMLNIAGIQIPAVDMLPKLKHSPETVPKDLLMDRRLWTQQLTEEEKEKHQTYTTFKDEMTLPTILDTLTPDDIRMLIETMDENNRRGQFERIFPTPETKIYHKFFERPRYYNILLDQWIQRYDQNEEEGIQILESYCREEKHLQP
ncbi:tubulin polyglutamylase TTLL4-like, partial [Lingula anatina]|uniref:Tubulin polyglutamylase TTLL4-like n=1 Tax=Lingula anatina TaxID=7574 RepID=A0A1S3IJ15_LINAN